MRISNIRSYLGGADNVIAEEVLTGNQFKKTISVEGVDFSDTTNVTVDVDYQLFKATVTQKGSKITLGDDFSRVAINGVDYDIVQGDSSLLISNTINGSFDILIPEYLTSQFTTANGATVSAPTIEPNELNPFIVVSKVQWRTSLDVDAEIRSVRFLLIVRYQPNI